MNKFKFIFLIILIFSNIRVFAIITVTDRLVFNRDTFLIDETPLSYCKEFNAIWVSSKKLLEGGYNTSCPRNYYADWMVRSNELRLIGVHFCGEQGVEELDLRDYFGDLFEKDKYVVAKWFSGEIVGTKDTFLDLGKLSARFESKLFKFTVGKGSILSKLPQRSALVRGSDYVSSSILSKYLIESVDWKKVPAEDLKFNFNIQFSCDSTGRVINVVPHGRGSERIKNVIKATMEEIPSWAVYKFGNEFQSIQWWFDFSLTTDDLRAIEVE